MSYQFYSLIHLSSLVTIAFILGALCWQYQAQQNSLNIKIKKRLLMAHGFVVFFLLVSGFGLLAKISVSFPWPSWLYVKLLVWLALAIAPKILKSQAQKPKLLSWLFLAILSLFYLAILVVRLK